MKPKLYLETTIPSYLTAWPSRDLVKAAKQQITRDWWEERRHAFDLFISEVVLDEAGQGDPQAARYGWRTYRASQPLKSTESP
jgi:hypothetical protein